MEKPEQTPEERERILRRATPVPKKILIGDDQEGKPIYEDSRPYIEKNIGTIEADQVREWPDGDKFYLVTFKSGIGMMRGEISKGYGEDAEPICQIYGLRSDLTDFMRRTYPTLELEPEVPHLKIFS